jgi:ABC-type Na+ efflux pump permease subunit
MISGFELLGSCAIGFGAALRAALGGRQAGAAPWLIQLAGAATIAAGLLRRDHVLLTAGPESWHNQAHNVISAAAYVLLIAAPLLLAWRFRRDPQWSKLAAPLVAAAVMAVAFLSALYAEPNGSWAATLQRIGVSLPLAAIVAVALRLTRLAGSPGPASPGGADAVGHAHPGRSRQPE